MVLPREKGARGRGRPRTSASEVRNGRRRLSVADRDRLRRARGAPIVATRSVFGPDTVTWRVNREAVLLLGGGRALLMQVAHPLVAAGVAAHSDFQRQPLQRLWRTLDAMLTITFGGAANAMRAVHGIDRIHARVHGVLDADVGPFQRGTAYDAKDPQLLLWVHATLVDTALQVYRLCVQPLSAHDERRYYDESKVVGRLLGVPNALLPPTLAAFRKYVGGVVDGDLLAVGPASRDIAASILAPPVATALKPVFGVANAFTVGLLPPVLRARYGLRWNAGRAAALGLLVVTIRHLLPRLPDAVRYLPHARRAALLERTPRRSVQIDEEP